MRRALTGLNWMAQQSDDYNDYIRCWPRLWNRALNLERRVGLIEKLIFSANVSLIRAFLGE